jgi:hypothetical protein
MVAVKKGGLPLEQAKADCHWNKPMRVNFFS